MSVIEVVVYLFGLAVVYWDWYLLIGVFLSVWFTNTDMNRYRESRENVVLLFIFGTFIGKAVLFITNAVLWPFEIIHRLYRDFLYAVSK
jgi:hypothetical protein